MSTTPLSPGEPEAGEPVTDGDPEPPVELIVPADPIEPVDGEVPVDAPLPLVEPTDPLEGPALLPLPALPLVGTPIPEVATTLGVVALLHART
jgi:hypothetical protein